MDINRITTTNTPAAAAADYGAVLTLLRGIAGGFVGGFIGYIIVRALLR